jgi:uncharacterized BrkB/YihY/UPF0761 family membrane protein
MILILCLEVAIVDYPYSSLGPALQALALILLFALLAAAVGAAVMLAALPGRIAARREHPQAAAVNLLGWLGLPSGILWVVAMVWAYWRVSGRDASPEEAGTGGEVRALAMQLDRLEAAITLLEQGGKGGLQ